MIYRIIFYVFSLLVLIIPKNSIIYGVLFLFFLILIFEITIKMLKYNNFKDIFLCFKENKKVKLNFDFPNTKRVFNEIETFHTDLVESKKEIEYENKYIKSLLEMSDEGVVTFDEDDKISYCNKKFLEILEIKIDIIKQNISDLEFFKLVEKSQELIENEYCEKNINFKGENGTKIISIKKKILEGQNETIVLIRDITSENKLKDIILESKKAVALSDLASGIAHEIRNPLTPIKGLLQILKQNLKGENENFDKYISIIFKELDKINNKITKLDRLGEEAKYEKENIDLEEVLRKIVNELKEKKYFNNKKISLDVDLRINNTQIFGNIEKIKEAMHNLLKNSCEAIVNNGIIELDSYLRGKTLVVEVRDNGRGINQRMLKKVSNPFYTTKMNEKSLGIGIPMSYKIINEHNGNLIIDSVYGKGTTVKILFFI